VIVRGTPAPSWTVLAILEAAAAHLARAGVPEARLEAELLLAEAAHRTRLDLYVHHDMPVGEPVRDRYRALVRRRAAREPSAYILGQREFYGRSFAVDPSCLIPRPETELIVDLVLARAGRGWKPGRGLDLGTGSGCLAITLALELGVPVTGTDISPAALRVAEANRIGLAPAAAIGWSVGDLEAALEAAASFDLVVSNPPYIPDDALATLAPEVRDHEPRIALASGADAWSFHRRILACLPRRLRPGGLALLELPGGSSVPLAEFRRILGPAFGCAVEKDHAGRPRVLVVENPVRAGPQDFGARP
jgi:release factor glutamine methyltransferase